MFLLLLYTRTGQSTRSSGPAKLTKSALKKQKALARQEKRQQEKAARAAARARSAQASPAPEQQQNESIPGSSETAPPAAKVEEKKQNSVPVTEIRQNGAAPPVSEPEPSKPLLNGYADTAKELSLPPLLSSESTSILSSVITEETSDFNKPIESVPVTMPASAPRKAHVEIPAPHKQTSAPPPPQDTESAKKRQNALTRTLWTFIMIGGFLSELRRDLS